ncbi:unnamed protein product [Rangifer tarandus platyrhynchus]|uniref:Uncharacterized protein n=1 Tax=Rangifer tarandus platyrhynchus TaxID=3082113 RepID=A0ABN8XJ11_RANTA|nr:unnamed protein product [Rangifer tarandus platyrhynchus]
MYIDVTSPSLSGIPRPPSRTGQEKYRITAKNPDLFAYGGSDPAAKDVAHQRDRQASDAAPHRMYDAKRRMRVPFAELERTTNEPFSGLLSSPISERRIVSMVGQAALYAANEYTGGTSTALSIPANRGGAVSHATRSYSVAAHCSSKKTDGHETRIGTWARAKAAAGRNRSYGTRRNGADLSNDGVVSLPCCRPAVCRRTLSVPHETGRKRANGKHPQLRMAQSRGATALHKPYAMVHGKL